MSQIVLLIKGKPILQVGHYNHSTGEYHYHHGYSAHQHPNGICPYDNYNDIVIEPTSTKINTSKTNTPTNNTSTNTTYKASKTSEKNEDNLTTGEIIMLVLTILFFAFPFILAIIDTLIGYFKRKFLNNTNSFKKESTPLPSPKKEINHTLNTTHNYICPKCGGKLQIKMGRYGKFIGCSNYPMCHYTKTFKNKK